MWGIFHGLIPHFYCGRSLIRQHVKQFNQINDDRWEHPISDQVINNKDKQEQQNIFDNLYISSCK